MKYLTFLSLLVIIPFIEGCSGRIYNNSIATVNQTIDGDAEEWLGRMTVIDSETGIQVAVSNNSENLYLCIQSVNEQINSKILLGGLEVWVDATGKGKKTTGIKYPLSRSLSRDKVLDRNEQQMPDLQSLIDLTSREVELVGFLSPNSGRFKVGNTGEIELNVSKAGRSNIVYEVKIPFRTFFKDKLEQQDGDREFAYTIIVNGLEKPQGFQGGPSGMGRPPGGGGNFPQGSPPGQMPAPDIGQSDIFNNSRILFKARLAI